jgi:hypothetical protein
MSNYFVDIHCHPSIKAYAKSYKGSDNEKGHQSPDPTAESSMWRQDLPSNFDIFKNFKLHLTNFIQSDTTTLLRGGMGIVYLSFYPQEKAFFVNKLGGGLLAAVPTTIVTEFTIKRIRHIQRMPSYWEDMLKEMAFLAEQENKFFLVEGKTVKYKIARTYSDIQDAIDSGELGKTLVIFVPTIEGLHIFDQVMDSDDRWDEFPEGINPALKQRTLERATQLRDGTNGVLKPVFVTFAHHFWNGLCGHEQSFGSPVSDIINQENGRGVPLTPIGREVIHKLLEAKTDANGKEIKPVIIDIKHMSVRARQEYFEMLDEHYADRNIPVVSSHGGVTGTQSWFHRTTDTPAAKEGLFLDDWINLFDNELLRIATSKGLFGIQLDERRIGSDAALKAAKDMEDADIMSGWAKPVWNQIRHIAELLDMNNLDAWNIQCLGTDFDGIVDPINGYWTSESMRDLSDNLVYHAAEYMKAHNLTQERNKNMTPEQIIANVMTNNARDFLAIRAI